MATYGRNMVVNWTRGVRRTYEAATVVTLAVENEYLEIGNFDAVGVAARVVSGGAATTFMQLEHSVDPNGEWVPILSTAPDNRIALGNRQESVRLFDKDANNCPLGRYLRWSVVDSAGAYDVTFELQVLLRR
jgi:hypothetical protein